MNKKTVKILILALSVILFVFAVWFALSHPYNWRFDQYWITGRTQQEILDRYGNEDCIVEQDCIIYIMQLTPHGTVADFTIYFEDGYATHTQFQYNGARR